MWASCCIFVSMETTDIQTEKHPLEPFLPEGARILMLGSFPPKRERWSMDFFYPNFINDMWRITGHIFFGDKEHFIAESTIGQQDGTSSSCAEFNLKYTEPGNHITEQHGKLPKEQNSIQQADTTDGKCRKTSKKIKPNKFNKEKIVSFCTAKGIALYDTACEVRRLKDNASDKFLEVVQATDLTSLLAAIPECHAIVTTGQKATDVIVETFGCTEPPVGGMTEFTIPSPDEMDDAKNKTSGKRPVMTCNGLTNQDLSQYHTAGQNTRQRTIRFWRMPSSSRAYPLALEKKAEYYRTMYMHEGLLK